MGQMFSPDPSDNGTVQAKLISFGVIEIDGERFEHDVVIEHGLVTKRKKGPSKPFRDEYGHTPLSAQEAIPWSGRRLIIGTGFYGDLPVMPEVYEQARRRNVELIAEPTADACKLLAGEDDDEITAILHVTC